MTATIQRHESIPGTAAAPTAGRLDPIITGLAPAAWGLTYIVTTELLPPGRPLLAAALRALPAGLALAAITRRRPTGSWWWKAAVLGNAQGVGVRVGSHTRHPSALDVDGLFQLVRAQLVRAQLVRALAATPLSQ